MSGFWTTENMKLRLPALIDPYDASRVVNCSYELSMGGEAFITGAGSRTKTVLTPAQQIDIPPGQFANLLTEERVEIPASALGLISVKFRLKQRGLINVSGFHVDPGFRGRLLFSVYNAGPSHVILARGDAAFLLWYADLEAATANTYAGTRAEQMTISSADVAELVGDVATPQALASRIDIIERRLQSRSQLFWILVSILLTVVIGAALTFSARAIYHAGQDTHSPVTTSTSTTATTSTTTVSTSTTAVPAHT